MLLDVQYLVANSHLLHVGPNDAVESQDQEFEVLDIKVRPTGTAHDNALVLVARYTCRTNLSKHKPCLRAQLQEQQIAGSNGDCGGMCVPIDQFVPFITNCEEIVSSLLIVMLHRGYI